MLESNPEWNEMHEPAGDTGIGFGAYLNLADHSAQAGRKTEAMMLYLTAYETAAQSQIGKLADDHPAVEGLHRAWNLACEVDDRSIAEAVFGRLQGHLSPAEVREYSSRLQELAVRKLKQLGLDAPQLDAPGSAVSGSVKESLMEKLAGLGFDVGNADAALLPEIPSEEDDSDRDRLTYDDLVGFETAVMEMRQRGYGLSGDSAFTDFIEKLNRRHGIDGLPSFETLLFRAPSREDAARMMFATAGELDEPVIRIRMDTNSQGAAVLCIMASPQIRNKFGFVFAESGERGIVILEDVDMWGLPLDDTDENGAATQPHLSRGAQKAIALIRAAVDNPNVVVMASASTRGHLEDYMIDLLSPLSPIDIKMPTYAERARLWTALVREHESLARLDVVKLVQASANMSRFEIAMCTRDAIEQAYRESILKREYVRVTEQNIYEKLAACQPLESREYQLLEDALVADFARNLDQLDTYDGEGMDR